MTEVSTSVSWNCSFLTKQEFDQLQPLQIVQRAEQKIKQLSQSLESITAKSSTENTNAEQLFQQLEGNYVACKKDLEIQTQLNQKLKNDLQIQNNKNIELIEESSKFKQVSIEKESKSNTLGKLYDDLHQEKTALHGIIDRKEKELKEETEAVAKLTERLNELIRTKAELNGKLLNLENDKTSNEYLIVRLRQEITELKKQNEYINESCEKHTKAYYDELKELKSMLAEQQSRSDSLSSDNSRLETLLASSRQRNVELEKSIDIHLEEIKKLRDESIKIEGQFEQELTTQQRLVQLYKDGQEEAAKKVASQASQIETLREVDRRMRAEHEEAYKKMEQAYDSLQEDYQRLCRDYDDVKKQLATRANQPIDFANMDIPLLGESVKRRIGEISNLGNKDELRRELFDMVQRYDELTKISLQEKREKRFLQDNLEHVLREVEKKAPIIQEKNKEYHRLLKSQEKLIANYQELQSEKDTLHLKISSMSTENDNLRNESQDLQKQVRRLLKEALDTNNNNKSSVPDRDQRNNQSTFTSLSSSMLQSTRSSSSTHSLGSMDVGGGDEDQIIPDSLVTFSNIEELQIRNQDLLRNIRNLTYELAFHQQSDKKLEMAMQELEVLKSARERQVQVIESLSSQRDYYKSHNINNSINHEPLSPSMLKTSSSSSTNQNQSTSNNNINGDYKKIEKEIEKITKQYKELQNEYESFIKERNSNEKSMQSKIDTLMDQNTSLRIQAAQGESQISLLGERLKLMTDSVELQKRELESYRSKNQDYMSAIVRHQSSLEEQRQQMNRLDENSRSMETKYHSTKSECEILKASEQRLIEQNQSLGNEKRSIENILSSINAMAMTKENAESELRRKLENELNTQEVSRLAIKKELELERQTTRDAHMQLTHQLGESRERFEKKEREVTEWKEKCLKHKIAEQTLVQKCTTLEQQLATAEHRFQSALDRNNQFRENQQQHNNNNNQSNDSSMVNSLDLNLAKSEIESLKESLTQEKENVIHYKSIAMSSENDLARVKEEFTKIRVEMEERLKETLESESKYQQLLQDQTLKMQKMESFSSSYKQDVDLAINERDVLVKERQQLQEKIEELTRAQQLALTEAKEQHELAKKATENYERELTLHADDVKVLPTLRSQLTEAKHMVVTLNSRIDSSAKGFEVSQQSWLEQESLFKSQITEMDERIKDLKHQNNLLTSQIESITSQSNRIDKMMMNVDQQHSGLLDTSSENGRMMSELRELVQVQAREQKILEVRNESLLQENSRLKQTVQQHQKSIDAMTLKLQEQQDHLKNITFNSKKHEDVLKQLDQMNLFRESNIMLKDETVRLGRTIESLNARLKESEELVSPLQQQNRRLASENEVLRTDIEALRMEIGTWQSKVQKLLDKYQSIDPEVHAKLVEQYDTLKREDEELRKQIDEIKKHAKHWKDETKKLNEVINELRREKSEMESARDELATLKPQIDQLSEEVATKKKLLVNAAKTQKDQRTEIESLKTASTEREKIVAEREKSSTDREKTLSEENNMLKSKIRVFESIKAKNAAQASIVPAVPTVAATVPVAAPTTPTNVTPVATVVATPPQSPFAAPILGGASLTDAPLSPTPGIIKKRIIKKPAAQTLFGQLINDTLAKPPATPPAISKPLPSMSSSVFSNTNITPSTTTAAQNLMGQIVNSIVSPFITESFNTTTTTNPIVSQPTTTSISSNQNVVLSPPQTPINDQPIGSPAQGDHVDEDMDGSRVEELEVEEVQPSHSVKKQKIDNESSINFEEDEDVTGDDGIIDDDSQINTSGAADESMNNGDEDLIEDNEIDESNQNNTNDMEEDQISPTEVTTPNPIVIEQQQQQQQQQLTTPTNITPLTLQPTTTIQPPTITPSTPTTTTTTNDTPNVKRKLIRKPAAGSTLPSIFTSKKPASSPVPPPLRRLPKPDTPSEDQPPESSGDQS